MSQSTCVLDSLMCAAFIFFMHMKSGIGVSCSSFVLLYGKPSKYFSWLCYPFTFILIIRVWFHLYPTRNCYFLIIIILTELRRNISVVLIWILFHLWLKYWIFFIYFYTCYLTEILTTHQTWLWKYLNVWLMDSLNCLFLL